MALTAAPTETPLVRENRHIERRWLDFLAQLPFGEAIYGTRAGRAGYPAQNNRFRLYYESDAGSTLVYLSDGAGWIWRSGSFRIAQAGIAAFVAGLNAGDAGLLLDVTVFLHTLRWDGAALGFAPGDDGSNYFIDAPSAPLGKAVQLCDGTATTYLKANGTTGSYTTKNLSGHYTKSVTAGADALAPAVAPGLTGTVENESAHTHAIDHDHPAKTSDAPSATAVVDNTLAGATVVVGDGAHTHDTDLDALAAASGAGMAHTHGLGTLAVADTGEPASFTALKYFRR